MEKANALALDTPCLIIDRDKLNQNLINLQQAVNTYGKQLHPHVKTHKCTALARLQIEKGACGLSATTLTEAAGLITAGLRNILITSPVVTSAKMQRLMQLRQDDPHLMVVVDQADNALAWSKIAKQHSVILNVLVDIDPGVMRTGAKLSEALALAQLIDELPQLNLRGIQYYAGNLQHITDYSERYQRLQQAWDQLKPIIEQFRNMKLCCEIVTGAGTGTYDIDMLHPLITEVQPGSYTVMDMQYRNIGSSENTAQFTRFSSAMTMLVTVISANHDTHVTVDAGTKALYYDPITKPQIISHPGLHYDWGGFGDEHGKITAEPGVSLPKVGEILELIVPHCDPTINLFDAFYIIENERVVDQWKIDLKHGMQ